MAASNWPESGAPVTTRQVHFAGSAVTIQAEDAECDRLAAFLFRDMPQSGPETPHVTYRIRSNPDEGKFFIYNGESCEYQLTDPGLAATLLMDRTCFHLADRSQGGLLFHAALLGWQGQGLLLPASSGKGKTTLAAWLLQRGYEYLTDELVFIPLGGLQAQALRRPLNLKSGSRAILGEMVGEIAGREDILSGSGNHLTAPQALRPGAAVLDQISIHQIIFPRFHKGGDFELRRLSRAQAGLALMQCLINARNLPEHGFPEVTHLARKLPAHQLTYGGFEQIGESIEGLFSSVCL